MYLDSAKKVDPDLDYKTSERTKRELFLSKECCRGQCKGIRKRSGREVCQVSV